MCTVRDGCGGIEHVLEVGEAFYCLVVSLRCDETVRDDKRDGIVHLIGGVLPLRRSGMLIEVLPGKALREKGVAANDGCSARCQLVRSSRRPATLPPGDTLRCTFNG